MNWIQPRTAYLLLAIIVGVALFALFAHSTALDKRICDAERTTALEVAERTDELNAILRSQRIHLRSRLAGDQSLIAEGPTQTVRALTALRGAESRSPVDVPDCSGLFP